MDAAPAKGDVSSVCQPRCLDGPRRHARRCDFDYRLTFEIIPFSAHYRHFFETIGGLNDTCPVWAHFPPVIICVRKRTGTTKGDTLFCSMTKAYEMLSPQLQKQLEGATKPYLDLDFRSFSLNISRFQPYFHLMFFQSSQL